MNAIETQKSTEKRSVQLQSERNGTTFTSIKFLIAFTHFETKKKIAQREIFYFDILNIKKMSSKCSILQNLLIDH